MTTGHLHSLCRQGSVSKIQSFLEEAEDIHNKLEERIGFLGYTPLHEAANEGRIDVVRLLLENGANANAEANGQYTPLHIAASMDNVDCVVELLKHNADVTKKDEFDKTPYRTAMIMKCKKAAQILKTEEIKRAARENSPNLKDLLASISGQDILPSGYKEALLEASSYGHVDAICSLVIAGAKMPLYLKDCIIQALRLDFCEAAATLLMCYAAKHDKRLLLKYLMSEETSREEEEQAILELPCPSVPRNTMVGVRLFIANKEVFPTAVPLELALQHRRKGAAEIILLNTDCDRQRRQVDWGNLAMGEIEPAWLENIKWAETILLVSNFLQRVPDNIYILDKLSCLDLSKNQLKTIPVCLLEMPSLCNLWLSENKIAELPKQCNWSSSLKTLDLNDNLLQTLPKSMAKAELTSLHVARNNLYYLPPWIEQMASLQLLDVSGNPRLKNVPQKLEKLNQAKSDSLIGENHQEADFLTDLDKLYLAMAEVGTELNFNILVYSLGITSINALKDYKSKDSFILHPDEINTIKKKLVNTSFKFDQLAQKYQQSNVVKTCQMKGISVIRKQDIVVTRTITCGQMAGYVCEAEWTKPGGIKEKVCLRYGETEKQLFLHEAEMANSFRHKYILDFHGVVIASSYSPYVALVEEFAEYGNLDKASEHHSVERLCRFTVQAASALEYLESKNVVHQLLQLYCMVVSDYQLKLAGIGYCEFLNDARRKRESGSPYSLPEEVVYFFAKLFSTAFINYQNQAPGFEAAEAVMDTSQNLRSKHGYLCPSHFCEVFDRCLRDNPKERPSFSEISQSLMAIENPLKVKVKRSFNAESAGFLRGETGELITLISKDRHREKKNVWLGETQSKEVGFFTAENVEEVPVSELTEDSSVPPEILARGPRAQRAYERALQIGKVKVYRGRIMILGQDRAGKTSLKKSLLGLPFDPQENSTIGVEVDPSRCELEVAQIKNWEPTERKKFDVSDFAEDMAKLVARDLNQTVDQENVSDFAEDVAKLVARDLDDKVDEENVSTAGSPLQKELRHNNLPNPAAAAAATATESTPDTIMVKEMEEESSDDSDLENRYQAELNIGSTSVVPNDVTELVVRYLKNLKLEEHIKAKEVVLTLWDFAGQHLYYASHSVFLSRRAIYMLVYNLHKSICAQAEPRVRQGTHEIVLDNPNNETNLDHLLSWLVSVHAIVPQVDQVGKALDSQATSVPYLRPPVIIVGTNADQPFEDPRTTEKCIQRSVSGKTYEKHVIRPFFAVDNTKSNKDLGVQGLRQKIMEVLNQEPYMGEEVPLRWFNFEKVVEALVAKGTYYMDLNQLLTVTRKVCRIYDGDELTAMLNFYHDLGVIVKHGQTVVLQAQWLIDLFKQLITVRPFDEVDPMFSECWLELEQSGILRMALVDHIFAEFIQEGLSKQDILDMMEAYGLIIKFSCSSAESEREQIEYFVPSQLRSSPSGLCELKPTASDPCPLYLHFLDGFVPNGFFPQLLSKCIHWCSKQRLRGPPQLFQNGARLFIGVHDIFELILLCRKRFIKVLLKNKTSSNSSAATCATRLMANKVRDSLEETLQSLSRELSWLCNLRYELCVLCTSCLQSSEPCTKHGLVSCDHDDCQHLLRVLPGEELCCLRSFCDYTVKVQGLDIWFLITTAYKAKMENGTAEASPVLDPHIVGGFAASTSVEDKVVMDRTLSFKSGVPSSSDLLLVASGLGSSWKMLGRILCLPEPVLEQIEEDERHLPEKCYAVLKKWIQTVGPAASYGCLAKALQHPIVRRSELATKYCHSFRETENVATQKTDSHLSDSQDSVDMVKNNKEVGLQCSLNSGDMKDRESVLSKEET